MKNLSLTSRLIYSNTLFNTLHVLDPLKLIKISLELSLIQENFVKKNLLNFLFFIFFIVKLRPKLVLADYNNALLKIRKGSLLGSRVDVHDLKKLSFLKKQFFSSKNFFIKKLVNKEKIFSQKLALRIKVQNHYFLSLLFSENFDLSFICKFKKSCFIHQQFVLSLL